LQGRRMARRGRECRGDLGCGTSFRLGWGLVRHRESFPARGEHAPPREGSSGRSVSPRPGPWRVLRGSRTGKLPGSMAQRGVATRIITPAVAALLLVAAFASRPISPGPTSMPVGDRAESVAVLPFAEGLVAGTVRLSWGEFTRDTERSRTPSVPLALSVLGCLLAAALRWGFWRGSRGRRALAFPLRRTAGPRAPPLQLA
jgi:hypothetical protein